VNLVGKSASQSSTGWSAPASKAIDGNAATSFGSGSCTHTHRNSNAWWQVDLGSAHTIAKLKVTNRGDCCGSRLNGFNVIVSNPTTTTCASNVQIAQGATTEFMCSATGRYVKIQIPRTDYLTLCEVKIAAVR